MGDELKDTTFSRKQRRQYRHKIQQCLDVFETMLAQASFDCDPPLTGMEIEGNLIGADYRPAMANAGVLSSIDDPAFQRELGSYNIEFNVPPRQFTALSALDLEAEVRARLNAAEAKARAHDARIVMIGILPTLMPDHLSGDWMSDSARYVALNDSIFAARGGDIDIDIDGPEPLNLHVGDIAPESACTSTQLHLQVSPSDFASHWNAAQVVAGPQLAIGANSPYFFGHRLWAETRVELFAQSTDTRPDELKNQGVRPRVWFGERWITSIFDLFEENVRYFPSLLPEISDEDPADELAQGRTPQLAELRLHNGTVYRWNRPVYDVVDGRPHLRVENRVLPSGPTVADMVANAVFYYGLLHRLAREQRPLWTQLGFAVAHDNFRRAARHGMAARLFWPGLGEVSAAELTRRELLPLARQGLEEWGVAAEVVDHYLGIIADRVTTGRNGATWQVATVRALQEQGASRSAALSEMLRRYCTHVHTNQPVHTWPIELD